MNNVLSRDYKKFTHYKRQCISGTENERLISSSTRLILKEASEHGMEITHIEGTETFKLKYGNIVRYFHHQDPGTSTVIGIFLSNSKKSIRDLLKRVKISVPKGYAIKSTDSKNYRKEVYMSLPKPLVVKPNSGSQGKAITTGISNLTQYYQAVKKAFSYSQKKDSWIIVEEELIGYDEYRVLTSRDKVIGVIKRVPANVIGDGNSNIRKLVKIKNSDPRRDEPEKHPPLYKIVIDDDVKMFLSQQGLSWKSIPKKGEKIFLRGVSNISMGGDSYDYTDKIHQSVKDICLRALRTVPGLKLGGIDFMSKDITTDQKDTSYAILEINNSPGIDIHDYPYEGKNRRAGREFLKILFPELKD